MRDKLSGKTILIVDDEPDLREMLALEINTHGIHTLQAESSVEGIKIYSKNKIDLIISDILMPNGHGTLLLKDLRTVVSASHLPFLFITAHSEYSREELFALGANDVFYKPFDLRAFLEIVKRYLLPIEERLALPAKQPIADTLEISPSLCAKIKIAQGGMVVPVGNKEYAVNSLVRFRIPWGKEGLGLAGIGHVMWNRTSSDPSVENVIGLEFYSLDDGCRQSFLKEMLPALQRDQVSYIPSP
jgi:CheY-like chemotaxis protein